MCDIWQQTLLRNTPVPNHRQNNEEVRWSQTRPVLWNLIGNNTGASDSSTMSSHFSHQSCCLIHNRMALQSCFSLTVIRTQDLISTLHVYITLLHITVSGKLTTPPLVTREIYTPLFTNSEIILKKCTKVNTLKSKNI